VEAISPPGDAGPWVFAVSGEQVAELASLAAMEGDEIARLATAWCTTEEFERTWERAEGEAEPWEQDAFFSPSDLAFWSEAATDTERREYERIWATGSLAPGQAMPCLDARKTVRKVAEFYRLPGWYLDEVAGPA
jgi:hypothetical protein